MEQSAKGTDLSPPFTPVPATNPAPMIQQAGVSSGGHRQSPRLAAKNLKPSTTKQPTITPSKKPHRTQRTVATSRVEKSASKKSGTIRKAPAGKGPRLKKDSKAKLQFRNYTGDDLQNSTSKDRAQKFGQKKGRIQTRHSQKHR